MSIQKSRIGSLNYDENIYTQSQRVEDTFLDNENGFTGKDVREAASTLGKEIQRVLLETQNPTEQSEMILYLLNARDVVNSLYRSKKYTLQLQRAPRPSYEGDTHEYVKASDAARAIDEENDRQGIRIYTVNWTDESGKQRTDTIDPRDLEPYLDPIRRAILEELKNHVDPRAFSLVEKTLDPGGRVIALYDDKILKSAFDHDLNGECQQPEAKRQRNEALVSLFHIPERSPYIAYQVLSSDFDTAPHEGMEIHRRLPIQTLDQILIQTPLPPFLTVLGYITDAMQGADFLVAHHLRLTDLAPHNIAINTETNIGMLFDYDGLRLDHQEMEGYMTHWGYLPPERRPQQSDNGSKPSNDPMDFFAAMHGNREPQIKRCITEAEMVFEMGTTLKAICAAFPNDSDSVRDIANEMTAPNPDQRPTFAAAIDMIANLHIRRAA